MTRFLPLNSLRTFEAAARHLSFSRAAEDLRLTHSAISHRIRALEDHLGVTLFVRRARGVELTEEGRVLASSVRQAFACISGALSALQPASKSTLTISVLPAFAARWLIPRLGQFSAKYPEIQINLRTSSTLPNFRGDGVDVGIQFGAGRLPGIRSEKLFGECLYPVASPRLPRGLPRSPDDLVDYVLISDSIAAWEPWLAAAGLDRSRMRFGNLYGDSALLRDAAVHGQGIALAHGSLADQDVASGRLMRLFDTIVQCESAYYLMYPSAREHERKIRLFQEWLLEEVAQGGAGMAPARQQSPSTTWHKPRNRALLLQDLGKSSALEDSKALLRN